jgi:hypothetical protein
MYWGFLILGFCVLMVMIRTISIINFTLMIVVVVNNRMPNPAAIESSNRRDGIIRPSILEHTRRSCESTLPARKDNSDGRYCVA